MDLEVVYKGKYFTVAKATKDGVVAEGIARRSSKDRDNPDFGATIALEGLRRH